MNLMHASSGSAPRKFLDDCLLAVHATLQEHAANPYYRGSLPNPMDFGTQTSQRCGADRSKRELCWQSDNGPRSLGYTQTPGDTLGRPRKHIRFPSVPSTCLQLSQVKRLKQSNC